MNWRCVEAAPRARPSAKFHEVLDVVLEDEQIGGAVACQPDERMIVVCNRAGDFFTIGELPAHRRGVFNEPLQVADLFQCLFGGPRTFSLLSRSRISYRFFRVCWGSTEMPPSCEEAEKLSVSP